MYDNIPRLEGRVISRVQYAVSSQRQYPSLNPTAKGGPRMPHGNKILSRRADPSISALAVRS